MYIKRNLEGLIRKYIDTPEIIAIVGSRQVGKTTLLRYIQEGLDNSVFLTFEDIEIRALFDRDIKSFIEIYIKPYRYIFIDEVQYAGNAGKSLKFIYDTVDSKKIFVSGSSALDLTINTLKYLAGRIFSFYLFPLTFHEFLSYKDPVLSDYYSNMQLKEGKKLDPVLVERFHSFLEEFIVYGGYPRVVISGDEEERKEVLKNIMNIYMLRDVRDILGLTDDYAMLNLIRALSLQSGNIISYQELSALTQKPLNAVKRYLNLLEKTFIIQLVKPFFTNKRTELVKNPKVYFYDTGLRNAIIGDFKKLEMRQDSGILYENHIFRELICAGYSVKYWRTKSKAEVDFIVNDKIPVEVKSSIGRPLLGKSLMSFIEKYHPEKIYIFNKDMVEHTKKNDTLTCFEYLFQDVSGIVL